MKQDLYKENDMMDSYGCKLITEERKRQINKESWTDEHDDKYEDGILSDAAICYADARSQNEEIPGMWPWADEWWKPSNDRIRNLTKAGALIAAEIDRLARNEHKKEPSIPVLKPGIRFIRCSRITGRKILNGEIFEVTGVEDDHVNLKIITSVHPARSEGKEGCLHQNTLYDEFKNGEIKQVINENI